MKEKGTAYAFWRNCAIPWKGKNLKRNAVIFLLAAGMMMSGCAATELEHRSFPLAVGIDLKEADGKEDDRNTPEGKEADGKENDRNAPEGKDADGKEDDGNAPGGKEDEGQAGQSQGLVVCFDFPDLAQISEKGKTVDTAMGVSLEGADMYHVEKSYENNTNRILDYNHMKAVVLGKNIFSDAVQLRALLSAWEQREASARNTSLFVGNGSAAEILSLTEETEGSMGTYLEEMLESQKDFKQNKIATVGNLMNQWHNQNELLLIPVLEEKGNRPVVNGYAAVSNFHYRGMLDVEEAMEAFLSQGLLQKFICEPSRDLVVEISDIRVKKSMEQEGELPVVTVSITGKGRLKSGQVNSVSQRLRLEKKIEQQLAADLAGTGERLQQEFGIDMTNSYISLGGLNRKLYQIYRNVPDAYNREVQQVFQVDISMINWE